MFSASPLFFRLQLTIFIENRIYSISDAFSQPHRSFLHRNSHLSQFPMSILRLSLAFLHRNSLLFQFPLLVLWLLLSFLHRKSYFSPFPMLFLQLLLTFCIGNLNFLHFRCFFSGRHSFFTSEFSFFSISDAYSLVPTLFFTSEFSSFSISDACSLAATHFLHRNSLFSPFPMLFLRP